jgi:hypothetical protein|tara:strand:+ start:642 stop:854 length:213 start_codon:yes stop_codon:yes gene_type:complete
MDSKEQALIELEAAIKEFDLKTTNVGMAIAGSGSFMDIMRDPKKAITTTTLDKINRYVLGLRGQQELPIE